jgi:hypothetical protein
MSFRARFGEGKDGGGVHCVSCPTPAQLLPNPVRKRWMAVSVSTPTWFEEAEDRLTLSPTQSNQNDKAKLV